MSYNILSDGKELKTLIQNSKRIAIVCAERGVDSVSAGVALFDYIKKDFDKKADLYYVGDLNTIPNELNSIGKIENNFIKRSLRVTIDYSDTDISSIDYYQKEDESKLVIDINSVGADFNIDKINYDFIGATFDLIIVIGTSKLSNLGYIYTQNRVIFNSAKVVNIDTTASNEKFGSVNILDSKADSLSGLMLHLLSSLGFMIDKNISKILLLGLSE